MVEARWRKWKSWSGVSISGSKIFLLTEEQKKHHMWRALWLTAQVEGGGKFGAVQSYDRAGISAGLEHKIAILPKPMKQGSIWGLLREFELYAPCEPLDTLWDALKEKNMFLAQDGSLRYFDTGKKVSAAVIRDTVAPPNGKVPRQGPNFEEAKRWAILFHNLFVDERTHEVQINSAITSLVSGNRRREKEAYQITVGVDHPTLILYG